MPFREPRGPGTRYYGEHLLVHEFAHAVMGGLRSADPELHQEIQDAYAEAKMDSTSRRMVAS